MSSPPAPAAAEGRSNGATAGLFAIALFAALYLAQSVFIPIAFGVMLYLLMRPLVRRLHALRVPRALAACLVLGGFMSGISVAVYELSTPASAWAERLPAAVRQLEVKSRILKGPVERISLLAKKVERATDVAQSDAAPVVALAEPGLGERLLAGTPAIVAGVLVVLITAFFLLVTGDALLYRLFRLVSDTGLRNRVGDIVSTVETGMGAYLRTITVINLGLGAALAAALFALGMPNPLLWGGVAAVVNFVPYVGPAVGIFLVAAASLVSFDTLGAAAVPPLVYLFLTTVEGNLLTPAILGRTFRISPLIVFVWLVFWTWLWSVPGAILAVPLLMLINIVCEQVPRLAFLPRLIRS